MGVIITNACFALFIFCHPLLPTQIHNNRKRRKTFIKVLMKIFLSPPPPHVAELLQCNRFRSKRWKSFACEICSITWIYKTVSTIKLSELFKTHFFGTVGLEIDKFDVVSSKRMFIHWTYKTSCNSFRIQKVGEKTAAWTETGENGISQMTSEQ